MFGKRCFTVVNTLRPTQNGRQFADDTFKWFFLNEKVWISIESSLKFVPKGPINNIPALVQIMAWRRPGDKPLSETMMVRLLTHICVTRPQWVNATCKHSLLEVIILTTSGTASDENLVKMTFRFQRISSAGRFYFKTWSCITWRNKQRVLMHGHQGWNFRHGLCHIYMRYVYIY